MAVLELVACRFSRLPNPSAQQRSGKIARLSWKSGQRRLFWRQQPCNHHSCGNVSDAAISDDRTSTLAGLETGIALANHEHLAAPAHDLAVAVPLFGGLQGRKHLHGGLLSRYLAETKRKV